jgi:hypothetical protein
MNSKTGETDFYQGKILGLYAEEASISEVVTVCVSRTALEFSDGQISRWLSPYGSIEGRFNYQSDKYSYKTDEIEVELCLKKHIPEYLPMFGRKIRIYYLGMKKQCNNCLGLGHLKSDCEEDKRDWFNFIEELIDSGDFDEDLFGDWPATIERKRAALKNNDKSGVNIPKRGGRGGRGQ